MLAAAHIPFEQRAAAPGIKIEVLLVALDDQFVPAVAVKIGELVALPVSRRYWYLLPFPRMRKAVRSVRVWQGPRPRGSVRRRRCRRCAQPVRRLDLLPPAPVDPQDQESGRLLEWRRRLARLTADAITGL